MEEDKSETKKENEEKESVEEDDGDEGDDEESGSETEEEIEPKLRYARLTNDVPKILNSDAASCVAIHDKFLALGTHLGVIHILDLQGNKIDKELVLHATTINQISIDDSGEYIVSCSNDGKVVVHGIYSTNMHSVVIERPVRSVALDPYFVKPGSGKRFIIGEDKVVLYEKAFLGRYRPTVLYQGEGPIRNIKWKERFVVWSSDKTVRVYDLAANITITVIKRDCDPKLRPELYRCNFFWKDNRTLLVGWANTVKVCNIVPYKSTDMNPLASKDQLVSPRFYVYISSIFPTEFCIGGISAMGDMIVLLTVLKDTELLKPLRPQLRVIEPLKEDFRPVASDILTLYGYESYRCNDYHLDSLSEEGIYFILSPKDFVIARPRDEDDHVAWLLDHEKFKEAVDAVLEAKSLKKHNLVDVGQQYLNHLLKSKRYNEAGELCSVIYGTDKNLWEEEVHRFQQLHQLRAIAPYLPIEDKDKLKESDYELVLNEFLQTDPKGLLDLVRSWPSKLYRIPTIVSSIREYMSRQHYQIVELNECLCELYIKDEKYEDALALYLRINNKDKVFELIEQHGLFANIQDQLEKLMELNPMHTLNLLVNNMDRMPLDAVVAKLKSKPKLLYEYFTIVNQKFPTLSSDYHNVLVELYAEFEPEKLLSFLKSSNHYSLEDAYKVCEQRNLIDEMIYLLGTMGYLKQSLQMIIHSLADIDRAINFCKENNDKELWEDLIEYSLDKPDFITVLLQNIGTHVDPIWFIQKIPNSLAIPGLRDSLVKILHDYNLQISVREGCEKIVVADSFSLQEKLNRYQRRGILVRADQICQACTNRLLVNDARLGSDIYIFNCRHGFHKECMNGLDTCGICSTKKRGPGLISNSK